MCRRAITYYRVFGQISQVFGLFSSLTTPKLFDSLFSSSSVGGSPICPSSLMLILFVGVLTFSPFHQSLELVSSPGSFHNFICQQVTFGVITLDGRRPCFSSHTLIGFVKFPHIMLFHTVLRLSNDTLLIRLLLSAENSFLSCSHYLVRLSILLALTAH